MDLTDGQTVDFGSVAIGTSVTKTFTVINDGTAPLNLTALNPASLPTGFTLVSNLGATVLAPGQSTTFTVQFSPVSAGSVGGAWAVVSDDANENPFDLTLSGNGIIASPEISVLMGGQSLLVGGLIDFGPTAQGTALEQTLTVRNDGTSAFNTHAHRP